MAQSGHGGQAGKIGVVDHHHNVVDDDHHVVDDNFVVFGDGDDIYKII